MKPSFFIKSFIVIAVLCFIGYIISTNNKVTNVTELVQQPVERYDIDAHVDSCCLVIACAASIAESKTAYEKLYKELDVLNSIQLSDGSPFCDNMSELYMNASHSYSVRFQRYADDFFQGSTWSGVGVIKNEAESLRKREGINQIDADSLSHYINYADNYYSFVKRLKALDTCTCAETYNTDFSSYNKYPYNNLSSLQDRVRKAKQTAKIAWQESLTREINVFLLTSVPTEQSRKEEDLRKQREFKQKIESFYSATGDSSLAIFKERLDNRKDQID